MSENKDVQRKRHTIRDSGGFTYLKMEKIAKMLGMYKGNGEIDKTRIIKYCIDRQWEILENNTIKLRNKE